MTKVKYLCFYSDNNDNANRIHFLSAKNKIDYILECLKKNNYYTEIISPNWSEKNKGIYIGRKFRYDYHSVKYFFTFGAKSKIMKFFRKKMHGLLLSIFLLFNIKKSDKLIVYHSTFYINIIKFIRKIKRFDLIIEVEEVYNDLIFNNKNRHINENSIFNSADKFILSTKLMNDRVNIKKKPYIEINGIYKCNYDKLNKNGARYNILYAGSLNQNLYDIKNLINCTKYLSNKYKIFILGIGSDEQIRLVKNEILKLDKKTITKIEIRSPLKGIEFTNFIQKCHIGINPRVQRQNFNQTSFPSKILTYLSNGLCVLTTENRAIKDSKIGELVSYFDLIDPKETAENIMKLEPFSNNNRSFLELLDKNCINDLGKILV